MNYKSKIEGKGGKKKLREKLKKEKGITLIALIITIIILVILAAVSIRAIANMGIVGRAINGAQDYAKASKEEETIMDKATKLMKNTVKKLNNESNVKESTYDNINGIYCNSPDLSGFNPKCTYYVTYDESGNPVRQGRLDQEEAPENWYNYKNKLWANVVTINNGNTTYWTWIPRFKYKVDSTNKTVDAKFVGMDEDRKDVCYMDVNDVKTEIDVSDYKLSEAFTFAGKDLTGYWVSKYRVQEGTDDGTASNNLTIANIEIDLSGFNPEVTKYVTYDNEGNETIGSNIQLDSKGKATNMPQGWYDYANKKWANIVTDNNGNKTYWTYIPRYEYGIWQYIQKTEVRFIPSTKTSPDSGYKIPESFTFGNKDLKGYWVSKYRVQEGGTNTEFEGTYYKK